MASEDAKTSTAEEADLAKEEIKPNKSLVAGCVAGGLSSVSANPEMDHVPKGEVSSPNLEIVPGLQGSREDKESNVKITEISRDLTGKNFGKERFYLHGEKIVTLRSSVSANPEMDHIPKSEVSSPNLEIVPGLQKSREDKGSNVTEEIEVPLNALQPLVPQDEVPLNPLHPLVPQDEVPLHPMHPLVVEVDNLGRVIIPRDEDEYCYTCYHCGISRLLLSELGRHNQFRHRHWIRRYDTIVCYPCQNIFPTLEAKTLHSREVHGFD